MSRLSSENGHLGSESQTLSGVQTKNGIPDTSRNDNFLRLIQSARIKPYYQDESTAIFNCDNRSILPLFPDKSFDLVMNRYIIKMELKLITGLRIWRLLSVKSTQEKLDVHIV